VPIGSPQGTRLKPTNLTPSVGAAGPPLQMHKPAAGDPRSRFRSNFLI